MSSSVPLSINFAYNRNDNTSAYFVLEAKKEDKIPALVSLNTADNTIQADNLKKPDELSLPSNFNGIIIPIELNLAGSGMDLTSARIMTSSANRTSILLSETYEKIQTTAKRVFKKEIPLSKDIQAKLIEAEKFFKYELKGKLQNDIADFDSSHPQEEEEDEDSVEEPEDLAASLTASTTSPKSAPESNVLPKSINYRFDRREQSICFLIETENPKQTKEIFEKAGFYARTPTKTDPTALKLGSAEFSLKCVIIQSQNKADLKTELEKIQKTAQDTYGNRITLAPSFAATLEPKKIPPPILPQPTPPSATTNTNPPAPSSFFSNPITTVHSGMPSSISPSSSPYANLTTTSGASLSSFMLSSTNMTTNTTTTTITPTVTATMTSPSTTTVTTSNSNRFPAMPSSYPTTTNLPSTTYPLSPANPRRTFGLGLDDDEPDTNFMPTSSRFSAAPTSHSMTTNLASTTYPLSSANSSNSSTTVRDQAAVLRELKATLQHFSGLRTGPIESDEDPRFVAFEKLNKFYNAKACELLCKLATKKIPNHEIEDRGAEMFFANPQSLLNQVFYNDSWNSILDHLIAMPEPIPQARASSTSQPHTAPRSTSTTQHMQDKKTKKAPSYNKQEHELLKLFNDTLKQVGSKNNRSTKGLQEGKDILLDIFGEFSTAVMQRACDLICQSQSKRLDRNYALETFANNPQIFLSEVSINRRTDTIINHLLREFGPKKQN